MEIKIVCLYFYLMGKIIPRNNKDNMIIVINKKFVRNSILLKLKYILLIDRGIVL